MKRTAISPGIFLSHTARKAATRSTLALLFLGDFIVMLLVLCAAFLLRFEWLGILGLSSSSVSLESYRVHIVLGGLAMAAILYFKEAYSIQQLARYRYGVVRMLACSFYWSLGFLSLSLLFNVYPSISRSWVALSGLLAGISLGFWRYFVCRYLIGDSLLQSIRRKTLVVGWNERAQQLYERSEVSNAGGAFYPFRVRGLVLPQELLPSDASDYPGRIYRGDSLDVVDKQLRRGRYDTLILADSSGGHVVQYRLQEACGRELVDFMVLPDFMHTLQSCLHVESFAGQPMLTQTKRVIDKTSSQFIKRSFDLCGALFGLLAFAPVIAFFCWRVYRESPGPVFYRQTRLGEDGKPFQIIKIRSMRLDAEEKSGAKWCTEDDSRRLSVGAFMRKYNIDELPQFWNVLRGDMSLVGPRPERPELISNFKHDIRFYNVRHSVKPGITGWAQVNGWRGDTCLDSRIASDIEYIERWSFWFDLYICFKTFFATKNAY